MRWSRYETAPFAKGDKQPDASDDSLTIYQAFFEITETLCRRYPALTPFIVRRERAKEVFLLIRRVNTHPKTKEGRKVDRKGRILVPAGDDWF